MRPARDGSKAKWRSGEERADTRRGEGERELWAMADRAPAFGYGGQQAGRKEKKVR